MTTFKEYASEHPTIQIDTRLNEMEISDDVRELLELHTQFDENVVDEFEMDDCTYARAMYFDDITHKCDLKTYLSQTWVHYQQTQPSTKTFMVC